VFLSLLFCCLLISFLVARQGLLTGVIILAFLIGLPIIYAVVVYPRFGIILFICAAFLINQLSRILPDDTPIGLVMDGLTYLLILGFFIRQKKERKWAYFNNLISYFVLAWLGYNLLEVLNPVAASILAWVYTVRTVAFLMLMYYIFLYHIRSKEFIKLLFKLWLTLELLAALSAFQQENFGFFPFEKAWLTADPATFKLLFIDGHLRKFAIFSDPVVFAYNMIAGCMICLAFITGRIASHKKVLLGLLAGFFLFVMLYSGTRAAYVLLPAGLAMLAILNFNKRVLACVLVGGSMLGLLIIMPTSNASLVRFQTAFRPGKDPSYNVRAENQRRIKPYILSHPIGGGLGSVGVWGQRFSPNSYLSKFPPDSGYVRVAVETGWIGLLLFCIFNFVILYKGISYYYFIRDPELKTYCLAALLMIFAFDIGNYPQQAFVQYPSNVLFYLAMSILVITMRLDTEQNNIGDQTNSPDIQLNLIK